MLNSTRYLKTLLIGIFIISLLQPVWADDDDDDKRLSDSAELSYVKTGGNTDVETLAAKNALKYEFTEKAFATWKIEALYGETSDVKSAERYETKLRGDYKLSEHLYWYGFGGWRQDKFSDLENRYEGGTGAGYPALKGERHFLSFELGLNYIKEEYTDDTEDEFMESRVYGLYEFVYDDEARTKFVQEVEYLNNFDDNDKYNIISVTSLVTAINKMLSLKVSYELRYDNLPVSEDLERTDTLFSTTLVLNY